MSGTPKQTKKEGMPSIPGYILECELGRGTSGVVYQARQVSVNRLVALKVMHPSLGGNSRSIRRLQREARIAAHLAHPSLIAAIDMGQTGDHWWFAMELVEGPTLQERLEKGGRLKERDALVIFIQLCDALQHASEKGVVHRDVKPANILLERPDFPRLVDLGLARLEDDPLLTRTGSTLGTPHYISPEQARDPSVADVRSDIWSLGATLFHTVCGQPPFSGNSTAEILSAVLYGAIPDPNEMRPELSKGLGLILRKCLSRDLNLRYFAPAELKDDLERVLDHRAPQISRRGLEPLDPTEGRRPSWLIGLGGLACVGLLAAGFVWRAELFGDGGSAPVQVLEPSGPWPPLTRFAAEYLAGDGALAAAFAELDELRPRVPASDVARWEEASTELKRRLQSTLGSFWDAAGKSLAKQLRAHEFSAMGERLDHGLAQELLDRTGFTPESLPRSIDRESFLRRTESYRQRLQGSRDNAQSAAANNVSRYISGALAQQAQRFKRSGAWDDARGVLAKDLWAHCKDSGADLRGLDRAALESSLEDAQRLLASLSEELESQWRSFDGGTLKGKVLSLLGTAERALREGQGLSALDDLERDFDQLLARHQVDRGTLALAPQRESLDLYLERRSELIDRADEIASEKGVALLASLDAMAQDFHRFRDYKGLLEFWVQHETDGDLGVVQEQVAIRLEGAQELEAFMQRAALGVQRLGGARISLSEGSINVPGKIVLRGEPLEVGFGLMITPSSIRDYLLRPSAAAKGRLLGTRALEEFAIEGADLISDLGLQLQRALFRYHEGDFEGARELLSSEGLRGGDLLSHDLGLRISRELGEEQEVQRRREQHAQREVERLIGRGAEPMDDKQRAVLIGRLLRSYRDVLEDSTESILMRTRASLSRVLPPSTLKDFSKRFGPGDLSFPRYGRVSMSFRFDSGEVGAWDRGDWYFTGDRAWVGRASESIDVLLAGGAPTLELPDPLVPDEGIFEVRLSFHQPKGTPPVLLAISALDYHLVFVGHSLGKPGRFLAGTSDLRDVGTRARAGAGQDFTGFAEGQDHVVMARLSRASGKVSVWVDDQLVQTHHLQPPKEELRDASLVIRSLEPIELREVRISAGRR